MEKVKSDEVFISCWDFLTWCFLIPSEEVFSVTLIDVYSDLPDSYLCVFQRFAGSFTPVVVSGGF